MTQSFKPLPIPSNLPERLAPLVQHLDGHYVPALTLAQRWGLSTQTLSNWRSLGRGIPAVILPGGTVRYRLIDIIAFELAGMAGPLTPERVALELAAMPEVSAELASKIVKRLTEAIAKK